MKAVTSQPRVFCDAGCQLAESPVWDQRNQRLWWVDISGRTLLSYDGAETKVQRYRFEREVGAVVLSDNESTVYVALSDGVYRYQLSSGALTQLAGTAIDDREVRFNDGKSDRHGRLFVGTADRTAARGRCALYRWDANSGFEPVVHGVTVSNGLGWSPDNSRMYYADSEQRTVFAFDYTARDGSLTNQSVLLRFAPSDGLPDGLTVDRAGMLWIAHWGGGKVSRWDPTERTLLGTIEVPAPNVTSCTFGGADLDQLFITTARDGLSESELQRYPASGSLFVVTTAVQGFAADRMAS